MKHKKWPIHIWFLDNDLQKSASYLTSKALAKSIDGCIGAMMSTYFYFIGVRSKKLYEWLFAKERMQETMDKFFPCWPLSSKPSFAAYGWKESKWCKMCRENFELCKSYLSALLDEAAWRDGHEHKCAPMLQWIVLDMPTIDLPAVGLDDVVLPWKAIDPKFRRADVIEGYRLQFMSTFEDNDPFKAYGSCKRDIPAFVLEHFNVSQAFES